MFDTTAFEAKLATSWLGRSLFYFDELPSTNSYAKKMESEGSLHGSLKLTDHQTAGRGQHHHKWIVDAGENLTFSLIFEPQKAERLNMLTLVCALAIKESVENLTGIVSSLKWPNDILTHGKKVCGILTETVFIGNRLERVVVGIGLNVNQKKFRGELEETATSLNKLTGKKISREDLLVDILQTIEYRYRLWVQHNQGVVKQVNSAMKGVGEWCRLQVNGEELPAPFKFLGVNEAGELLAMNKALDVKKYSYEQVRIVESIDS